MGDHSYSSTRVITWQRRKHVVMMSLEDYNRMQETLHLLGSFANADRLRQSISEFKVGKTFTEELRADESSES